MISAADTKRTELPGPANGIACWPAAKVELWPIERLTVNPRNARLHGPEQIEQIRASLREFGWTKCHSTSPD